MGCDKVYQNDMVNHSNMGGMIYTYSLGSRLDHSIMVLGRMLEVVVELEPKQHLVS
jgi:hypothetical protein